MEVAYWIRNASIVSPLIPLGCFLIYRKKQSRQNLILTISLCISFTFDLIGWSLATNHKTNGLSNNLYCIIAFPAIMWFYHETLTKRSFKVLIRIFTIAFFLLVSIFALVHGLVNLNYYILTLSSILITITSSFFVADLNLMDDSIFLKNPYHETNIILNTSLALYYFITTIFFAASEYVNSHTSAEGRIAFWACHNLLNIMKNIGITVAYYQSAKKASRG